MYLKIGLTTLNQKTRQTTRRDSRSHSEKHTHSSSLKASIATLSLLLLGSYQKRKVHRCIHTSTRAYTNERQTARKSRRNPRMAFEVSRLPFARLSLSSLKSSFYSSYSQSARGRVGNAFYLFTKTNTHLPSLCARASALLSSSGGATEREKGSHSCISRARGRDAEGKKEERSRAK